MIADLAGWYDARAAWALSGPVPDRSDFGARYPWRAVAAHTLSRGYKRRIAAAVRTAIRLQEMRVDWRAAVSGGKDSTAMAVVLVWAAQKMDREVPRFLTLNSPLDFPGVAEHNEFLAMWAGTKLDTVRPTVDVAEMYRARRISLVDSSGVGATGNGDEESFFGPLREHRAATGYTGVILGLRGEESHGRAMNRASRGQVYERSDGLHVAQPISDLEVLDVHALCADAGLPLHPLYLCVDPGQDPLRIRQDTITPGGAVAKRDGHYGWLRRWWPEQWEIAAGIDPEVRAIS